MCILCECEEKGDYSNILGRRNELRCSHCPNLTSIPNIVKLGLDLKELYCRFCPNLTSIPNIVGLRYLNCSNCPSLTSIPNIIGLEKLDCSDCPNITSIPRIVGLKELNCCYCSKLNSIPRIAGLKKLICSNCPILRSIPGSAVSYTVGLNYLVCYNCPWLNHIENSDYENNINKLILLQRFCKKNFKYFVFKRWINSLEFKEWFYSPENVGGIKHKKMMEKYYKLQESGVSPQVGGTGIPLESVLKSSHVST